MFAAVKIYCVFYIKYNDFVYLHPLLQVRTFLKFIKDNIYNMWHFYILYTFYTFTYYTFCYFAVIGRPCRLIVVSCSAFSFFVLQFLFDMILWAILYLKNIESFPWSHAVLSTRFLMDFWTLWDVSNYY